MALMNAACNIGFNANAWLQYNGTNESAFHYFAINQGSSLNGAALAGAFINVVLTDGYLLVRCYRWWKNLWVIIPLASLALVSYVWDLIEVTYTAGHVEDANSGWVMPFLSSWPITIGIAGALHAIYTALLASRVIRLSRQAGERAGIWATIVESALPYGIISFVFMILYCASAMAANVFIPLLVQLQGITVDLIIMRTLKAERQATFASLPAPVVTPQEKITAPISVTATSTTGSASITDEKTMLVRRAGMWEASLDKKEPAPPEYTIPLGEM